MRLGAPSKNVQDVRGVNRNQSKRIPQALKATGRTSVQEMTYSKGFKDAYAATKKIGRGYDMDSSKTLPSVKLSKPRKAVRTPSPRAPSATPAQAYMGANSKNYRKYVARRNTGGSK